MSLPIEDNKIIKIIPNQPISFEADSSDPCILNTVEKTCAIFQPGDPVKMQFEQKPCGANIFCDVRNLGPELNPDVIFWNYGDNIITDGDFSSNTNWTESPPDFTIAGGLASVVPGSYFLTTLEQDINAVNPAAVEQNQWHSIEWTLANVTAGGYTIAPVLYGAMSPTYFFANENTDGLKTSKGYAYSTNTKFGFYANGVSGFGMTADISNLSIKRICPDWLSSDEWLFPNEPGFLHIGGVTHSGLLTAKAATTPNQLYYVSLIISGMTTGDVTVIIGGVASTAINTNGTHSFHLVAGPGSLLQIGCDPFFDGMITYFSYKEADNCFTIGDGWQINEDGSFSHPANALTDPLQYSGSAILDNTYYKLKMGVAIVAGSLKLYMFGKEYLFTETTPDPIEIYGLTNGDLAFLYTPSDDFEGAVYFEMFPMNNIFNIGLYDLDDNFIVPLDQYLSFNNQWVNMNFDFAELVDESDNPVPYGCYKICLEPPCEEATRIVANDFDKQYENNEWTLGINCRFDMEAGELVYFQQAAVSGTNSNSRDITIISGKTYRIRYRVSDSIGTVAFQIGMAGHTFTEFISNQTGIFEDTFVAVSNGSVMAMIITKTQSIDTTIKIDWIIIEEYNQPDALCSQCLQYGESFECTKLIEATCNNDSFGFSFGDFTLVQRLTVARFGPSYPLLQTIGVPTTGQRIRTHAEREKKWKALFDYMGEIQFDCLTTQLLCDKFTIDGLEFFYQDKTISPKENKEGESNVWQLQIDLYKQAIITKNTQ